MIPAPPLIQSAILAAYNWGSGNVSRHPNPLDWPDETRKYVKKIYRAINKPIPW